ncbi:MAG: hypothetical protein ACOYXM_13090 [Actinomycetota bacterium]
MRSAWYPRLTAGIAGAALAIVACSSDSREPALTDTRSAMSSPFSAVAVPADYTPVAAGIGTAVGEWGEDSTGTVEPYTVLSPDGRVTGPDVVFVSITGFEGYQGGLGQASRGYLSGSTDLTIDGADAIYSPARRDERGEQWADLVVVRGDDLAVRVSSPEADAAELTAIAERVAVPDDRTKAPTVPDPPTGLRVVGSVDVDGVLASEPYVALHSDQVPGPRSAHAGGWVRTGSNGEDQLSVLTVPGRSLDIAALPVWQVQLPWLTRTSHERDVDGRPAVVIEELRSDMAGANRRSVLVEAEWGDVVVVSATGASLPSEEALVLTAASVRPAEDAMWERSVIDATGGPGLNADEGRHELARGRDGGLGWLLQDGPPGGGIVSSSMTDPDSLRGVDPCLKLSNRTRACAYPAAGGEDDWYSIATGDLPAERGLSFVLVSTTVGAASVRVTTSSGTATAALVEVPAGGVFAAAVFVGDPGSATCDPAVQTPQLHQMRIEALDSAGTVVACLDGLPPRD